MTTPAPRAPALPGFSSPAAGFDDPLAMLHGCHDRVRRSLQLLQRLCERAAEGRVDAAVQDAARDVLRYFDQAAPQHHQDEERHVFPRLLAASPPAVREAVRQLQDDHRQMQTQWALLRAPLDALAAGGSTGFGREQSAAARRFCSLHEAHLRTEESLAFPAAAALLDEQALRAIGEEMASRRGVRLPAGQLKGE